MADMYGGEPAILVLTEDISCIEGLRTVWQEQGHEPRAAAAPAVPTLRVGLVNGMSYQ
jgi:hypothetical protein